ncbi:MAG: serine kinase [Bacteroidales bacterium]|nr:serine kinase [Bacteroidales bacterium]
MNLQELIQVLNLKVFTCKDNLNKDVEGAYVSDLLSDVLGNAKADQIWITLQTHKNIVAIAHLKGLSAVVLVKGLVPNQDTIQKAEEEKIVLLGSEKQTFDLVGEMTVLFSQNKEKIS